MNRMSHTEYLSCRINAIHIGLSILRVQEVFETRSVSRLPNCPRHLVGMVNVRGRLIPVVDCWRIMGTTPTLKKMVILKSNEGEMGLLISELLEIIHIEDTSSLTSPVSELEPFQDCFPKVATLSVPTFLLDLDQFTDKLVHQPLVSSL